MPYRDSKLTHLLENALGGDSNICVICTMSAEEEHCAETLETLKFAGRCSQVETQAKKNVVRACSSLCSVLIVKLLSNDRALIRAKDKEIEELRLHIKNLAEAGSSSAPQEPAEQIADVSFACSAHFTSLHQLADSVAAMEARKTKLTIQLAKLNGEILTSEIFPQPNTIAPATPKPKRRRISDFNMMGKGTPTKVAGVDRRAVSSMVRVPEDAPAVPSEGSGDPLKVSALL